MVNKSRLNKSSIHSSIIKLINYLYYENHRNLTSVVDTKLQEFKLRNPKIEPSPLPPTVPVKPIQEDVEEDSEDEDDTDTTEDQTDEDVTDTDEDDIEADIGNNDNKKKPRKKLSKNFRTRIVELQGTKEKITGVEFCSFIRSEIDHIDGNPGNDADINLQAISPNLHSVKTNDPSTYAEIEKKPHIYNIKVALAHLDSPVTLSNLSRAEQTKLLQLRKFLKTLINPE
jgi:hypothetical protein